jgi:hypothetical protein
MPTADHKLSVFLCHSKEDKPIIRNLYSQMTSEGWIDVWLDEIKLLPGQEWDIEIEKAVEQADVVIVCLSNKSVDKEGYIQKELRFVLNIADEKPEGTIFVVPLRLDDCAVPRRIRAWQYVDYFPQNNQAWAYKRLIESLQLRARKIGIPIEDRKIRDEREQKVKEEREHIAAQKDEAERIEREKVERWQKAKEDRDRIAVQYADAERYAGEKTETEERKNPLDGDLYKIKVNPKLSLALFVILFLVGGLVIFNAMGIRLPNGSPLIELISPLLLIFGGLSVLWSIFFYKR